MPLTPFRQWSFMGIDAAGLVACALVWVLFYLTTAGPLLRQRSAAEGLRREVRAQQQKATDLQGAMATARQRLAAIQEEYAMNPLQLDSAAHVNRKIARLTEFFSGCEFHIDSMQTGRASSGLQCDVIPITIVGRGAYRQCVRLLHGLCSTFPDMSVIRVELAGNPARPSELEKCRFELFWYATRSQASQRQGSEGT